MVGRSRNKKLQMEGWRKRNKIHEDLLCTKYQLLMMNVIIMYCKHVPTKIKMFKEGTCFCPWGGGCLTLKCFVTLAYLWRAGREQGSEPGQQRAGLMMTWFASLRTPLSPHRDRQGQSSPEDPTHLWASTPDPGVQVLSVLQWLYGSGKDSKCTRPCSCSWSGQVTNRDR